jgi:hypothetical protein
MRKKQIIEFESVHPVYPDVMVSAKTLVPKWFKDEKILAPPNTTFKDCVPFLESLISGYFITLPVDILVTQRNGNPFIDWKQSEDGLKMIGFRLNESVDRIPTPHGYHKDSFYWHFPVSFKLPLGYSALLTQPINRFDLPFQSLSIVLDGGYVTVPEGRATFFIRKGFEGIIPQGTPIIQIIPFKNEDWIAKSTPGIIAEGQKNNLLSGSVYKGWYKKTWWTKKNYN